MKKSLKKEIQRYLRNGEHDASFLGWPGEDIMACAQYGHSTLLEALISMVRKRTARAAVPTALAIMDVVTWTRAKVAPMVRGLFPRHEHAPVLDVLGRSVVFLTPANIETVLREMRWLGTAWDLANLYLESFGAKLLSKHAPRIVGLSDEMTCYVSADYFREESRVDDFVVHEATHIFHNCKRRTIGLRETRRREWLAPWAHTVPGACHRLQPHPSVAAPAHPTFPRTRPEAHALLYRLPALGQGFEAAAAFHQDGHRPSRRGLRDTLCPAGEQIVSPAYTEGKESRG